MKRIAVILPVDYRGGSFRGAELLASALVAGSREAGDDAEVVLLQLEGSGEPVDNGDADSPPGVVRRTFQWVNLTAGEARAAMRFAGHTCWEPAFDTYQVVDDGMAQLVDCDVWLFVSDRILVPVLPIRPIIMMIYDYIQRYVPIIDQGGDYSFIQAARDADRVFVTTDFTRNDALQYAGVKVERIRKLPMLVPSFSTEGLGGRARRANYFLWATNAAPHKNHMNALQALDLYYNELDGVLDCWVTGVNTQALFTGVGEYGRAVHARLHRSSVLLQRVLVKGELPDLEYRRALGGALFLWHPAIVDNGTFSVIEAAQVGVPSLSSDYPAMREIDAEFGLQLNWMDARSPSEMASMIKKMEGAVLTGGLVSPFNWGNEACGASSVSPVSEYWRAVQECL